MTNRRSDRRGVLFVTSLGSLALTRQLALTESKWPLVISCGYAIRSLGTCLRGMNSILNSDRLERCPISSTCRMLYALPGRAASGAGALKHSLPVSTLVSDGKLTVSFGFIRLSARSRHHSCTCLTVLYVRSTRRSSRVYPRASKKT